MSAHTPGPWEVGEQDCLNALDIVAEGTVIASVQTEQEIPEGECQERANARLIAAAPQLLSALINALVFMGRAGANADTKHPLRPAWEDARAAIAKAEGRS